MTAALILAAGAVPDGTEFGPTDDIGGLSPIMRLILVFQRAGIRKIVVVTGHDSDAVERHCAHMGVVFLHNDGYENGDMLSSVKTGLSYLSDKCKRVFISPVSVPLFSIETVIKMLGCTESVVIPMFNNKTGHPLLISSDLFMRVLHYGDTGGLEGALSGDTVSRRFFDVSDEGVLPLEPAAAPDLPQTRCLQKIRPDIRVRLTAGRVFFGPGTLLLLSLTNETGSLKRAARRMGISYSKAIKMIIDIEQQTGTEILLSKQGGSRGGSSVVTEKGLELARRYEIFESECIKLAQDAFDRVFGSEP